MRYAVILRVFIVGCATILSFSYLFQHAGKETLVNDSNRVSDQCKIALDFSRQRASIKSNRFRESDILSALSIGSKNITAHTLYSSALIQWPLSFCIFVYGGKGDVVSRHLLTEGKWEPAITRFMRKVLNISKSNTYPILDFGANLGWFSVIAAMSGHQVIAIEPSSRNIAAIQASFLANNISSSLLETHQVALHKGFSLSSSSNQNSRLCLGYYEKRQKEQNPGNYFLLPSSQVNSTEFLCDELVSLSTLDHLIRNRDILFVKADCEGCEPNALIGAENLLRSVPPCVIYTEATGIFFKRANVSAKDFFLFMRGFGYRIFHFKTEQKKRPTNTAEIDDMYKYSLNEEVDEHNLLQYLSQPWQIDIVYIHPRCFSKQELEKELISSH